MSHSFTLPLSISSIEAHRPALTSAGITIPPAPITPPLTGTLPKTKGISVSYRYDGTNITFTIDSKPMLIPNSMVESKISEALKWALGDNYRASTDA